jgi:Tfp pilus assembly protein PilF
MDPRCPWWIAAVFLFALAGCQLKQAARAPVEDAQPIPPMPKVLPAPGSPEEQLAAGLRYYDEGNFKLASKTLKGALTVGLSRKDEVIARKHLAFMHCMSERDKQCRDEFRKTLALDPRFELSAAEAGHPQWGPVFRSVKSQQTHTSN